VLTHWSGEGGQKAPPEEGEKLFDGGRTSLSRERGEGSTWGTLRPGRVGPRGRLTVDKKPNESRGKPRLEGQKKGGKRAPRVREKDSTCSLEPSAGRRKGVKLKAPRRNKNERKGGKRFTVQIKEMFSERRGERI